MKTAPAKLQDLLDLIDPSVSAKLGEGVTQHPGGRAASPGPSSLSPPASPKSQPAVPQHPRTTDKTPAAPQLPRGQRSALRWGPGPG